MPRDPYIDAEGTPRPITRAAFEVLGRGRIRWQMFAGDTLNHSEVLTLANLPAALETAGILLEETAQHAQEETDHTTETEDRQEADRPAG